MTTIDRPGLPSQPTPLIGRARELAALRQLLRRDRVRLLTICGPAGIGKTRLGTAAAERASTRAVFVDLSLVSDSQHVLPAIADALGLADAAAQPSVARLGAALAGRSLLLLLDNAEHVLAASTDLANLLDATDRLRLLVTSRAPLRLRREHVFEVPPLELPDLAHLPSTPQLSRIASVAMFLERVRAAGASLRLDEANRASVAELCVRLDGVPLAIELAAAQTRLITPAALLARAEHHLDLLTDGRRDQPSRHQSLRAALVWSDQLLTDRQRVLFRRLGAFAGGIALDAARAVAGSPAEPDLLSDLGALVDYGLLQREPPSGGEPRFRMLETIRAFARERLALAGEADEVHRAFASFWCGLAEAAERELRGPDQLAWLDRLEREWSNLNRALTWCEQAGHVELGVRLAAALGWFWYLRGDRWEGRTWCERFATLAVAVPSAGAARARALSAMGIFAQYQLDLPAALALQEEALALGRALGHGGLLAVLLGRLAHLCLARTDFARGDALAAESYESCRELDDRWGMAFALGTRGLIARSSGRLDDATRFLLDALRLFRQQGDRWGIAHVLLGMGQVALHRGDADLAEECWEERLQLSRALANETAVGHTLDLLAGLARRQGDHPRASARYEEALTIRRKVGDRAATAWVLQGMGELALERGDRLVAYAHLRESLLLRRDIDDQAGLVASLVAFARLAAVARRPLRSLRLAGAAEALYRTMGPTLAVQPYSQGVLATTLTSDPDVDRARRLLGRTQRTAATEEGGALALTSVIAEALDLGGELAAPAAETTSEATASRACTGPTWNDLTRRERDVGALLARGYTNRQIAAELVITEGSAHLHVVRLLSKLGFHTRAQVAAWAVGQGIPAGTPAMAAP